MLSISILTYLALIWFSVCLLLSVQLPPSVAHVFACLPKPRFPHPANDELNEYQYCELAH